MKAAKKQDLNAEPVSIRYVFAEPDIVERTDEKLRKETLRMLTHDEIRTELEDLFKKLPEPITVVFANQKCQSCGQVK